MSDIANLIFIFGAKYLYLIIIIISFIWLLNQPKPKQREILIIACISLALILIIFKIASNLYYNPRPFVSGHFKSLIYHKADNGFPSHHMLVVSFVSAVVFLFDRRAGVILWVLAFFVGFSRVYAGLHHSIDIAGGALVAIISVTLGCFLIKYLKDRKLLIFREE